MEFKKKEKKKKTWTGGSSSASRQTVLQFVAAKLKGYRKSYV